MPPKPTPRDVRKSVLPGLGIRPGLTAKQLTYLEFEPTLGITAARINKLGMAINNFREPLERSIVKVMIPSFQKNFASGGRPKWAPWSEGTIDIRNNMGTSGRSILVKSGALQAAATSKSIWTITDDFAIIKDLPAGVWYGKLHQAGYGGSGIKSRLSGGANPREVLEDIVDDARRGRGPKRYSANAIPARPFVVLQDEDQDEIVEVFLDWMDEQIRKTWPG